MRMRPENAYRPNPAPFDDTTTHKTNFVPYSVPVSAFYHFEKEALRNEELLI